MSRVSIVSSERRFPRSLIEFQSRFATEIACAQYLFEPRWPEEFGYPGCGEGRAWLLKTKALTHECADCGPQTSVTAGTIMHVRKLSLTIWFWAAFLMATHSNGISALELKNQLGLGSYRTAWILCAKLRRAMVNPELDLLSDTWARPMTRSSRSAPRAIRSSGRRAAAVSARCFLPARSNRPMASPAARGSRYREFWQSGPNILVLGAVVPQTRLVTDDWPSYQDTSRAPAQRDHFRPDGGAHRAALDPSAVLKSQGLGPGRLPRTSQNQPPPLPRRVRVPLQSASDAT
jgi:hypothetical protein